MAGGIFPGYPFSPNWKCIIFTAMVAGGYWWLPSRNSIVLLMLLWLPYVSLAWYDYVYQCRQRMHPTLIPFGRFLFLPFKDPDYKREFASLPPVAIDAMDTLDHVTMYTLGFIVLTGVLMNVT